jgi:hypothetical protein
MATGAWAIQLKKDTGTTFRELTAADLTGAFLVVRFTTA